MDEEADEDAESPIPENSVIVAKVKPKEVEWLWTLPAWAKGTEPLMYLVGKLSHRTTKVEDGEKRDQRKLKKAAEANFDSMALRCNRPVPASISQPSTKVAEAPMPETVDVGKKGNIFHWTLMSCNEEFPGNVGETQDYNCGGCAG